DYNQIIIDDIHKRLDNGERLLIIIRGCPDLTSIQSSANCCCCCCCCFGISVGSEFRIPLKLFRLDGS
ncbi:unnamed protein product, partial [Rotaria sp. Silwood1]